MNNIDVNAINKKVFLGQTPQMVKDQMKRKLYGESINEIGDTPKGRYMIGQASHKVRNDDVRWQKISNYLRDKYGWTPREYFDGQNDASYGVNKYNTQEDIPPFIEPYVRKVAKESVDRFNESKNMNRINEIGDTPKGQEMLGRTAERAYQRAARTSGADKQRFMKTYNDAYKSGGKSSNKHLGGTRKHFDSGRDYEYEKWADEHNGNVTESKTMNRKLIRLTESDLHRIVKESVNKILKESNYNNYFDWANRSGASDDEIEAA